jgi:predicted dehydrogenase
MADNFTRRQFLSEAAGAGLVVPVARAAAGPAPKTISANDKIRVACIGLGIMGNKDCATALKVPGVQLVAACDLYTGRLTAAREKYGNNLAVTNDYRVLLDRSDIDAIIVATSDQWHARIASAALKKGKAVYCEKPMVREIGEGTALLQTQRETQGVMQVGSQWVSSIVFQKAREQYRAGAIGQLNCIEASFDRQSALGAWEYTMPTDASPDTVAWDKYLGDGPKIPYDAKKFFWWRNYREFGTGVAGDLFVHLISWIHVVTGSHGPVRIFASGQTAYWKDGRDVPDVLTAIMEYPESAEHPSFQLTLRVDFASGNGERAVARLVGSEGVMDMSWRGFSVTPHIMPKAPGIGGWDALDTYPRAMQVELRKRYDEKYSKSEQNAVSRPATTFQVPASYDEHVDHFTNFFDAMRGKAKLNEDVTFGLRAAAPSLACNKSYFEKKIIHWNPHTMRLEG